MLVASVRYDEIPERTLLAVHVSTLDETTDRPEEPLCDPPP